MPGNGQRSISTAAGVSVWLDGLDRELLVGGGFARLIRERSVTGVVTNPATLHAALVNRPERYAVQLGGCRASGLDASGAVRALAAADVRLACDDLLHLFHATGGLDGYASIEVDPRLAGRADATVADARSLTRMVDRPNVMVGIPATDTGLEAIPTCLAEGISVNVTLICGLHRYARVIDAYMDGLERRRLLGGDLRAIASVASPALGGGADSRLACRLFAHSLLLPRWSALAAAGARPQRLLWPATSDPSLHAITRAAARNVVVVGWTDDDIDAVGAFDAPAEAEDGDARTAEGEAIRERAAAWRDAVAAVGGIAAPAGT